MLLITLSVCGRGIMLLISMSIAACQHIRGVIHSESSTVSGDSSRQCECWLWPTCISNCSGNPILKVLFENEYKQIAKLNTPFFVIFPFQVRRQKSKKTYTNTLNKQGQYRIATNFWVQLLSGEDVQLKLQKSKIFGNESTSPNNYMLKYSQKSGEIVSNNLKKCFYTGTVFLEQTNTAVSHSYVAVDTCDGLRGIIQYKGIVFGIRPIKYGQSNENEPIAHFVYSETTNNIERVAKDLKSFWHMFSIVGDSEFNDDNLLHIVPISLIIDHTLMNVLLLDVERASQFAISLLNIVTKSFMSLRQIELQLAKIDLWNMGDKFPISNYIKTTMNDFLKHQLRIVVSGSVAKPHRGEITILLSGHQFHEEVEYFSVPGSVCTKRSMSVIQVTSPDDIYHVSRLVSLAVAEIFGINSFPCPDRYECGSKIVLSKGDETRLKLALLSGHANCLKKESMATVIDTCGNGRLDRGEECDAINGQLQCCDNVTCMVANYAQCNGGECCSSNCTLQSPGKICRPSKDHCDIPEFCSGDTETCPRDLFLENGNQCNRGSALCYQGRCPTRDSKCQTLWGPYSKEANQHCYSTFNLKHVDSCGLKQKCSVENQMCGVLHCRGGSESPNDPHPTTPRLNPIFIDTYLKFNNDKIQCKYLNNIDSAYVEDGTECGTEKYCFGKTCSSATSKIVSQCPKDNRNAVSKDSVCYSRGICTNIGICLCHPGWTGANCSIQTNESFSSGEFGYSEQVKNYIWAYLKEIGMYNGLLYKHGNRKDFGSGENLGPLTTVHLVLILVSVIVTVFLILAMFLICGRIIDAHTSKGKDGYCCNSMKEGIQKKQDKDASSYRSCISEDGTRSIGRKYNQRKGSNVTNDLIYDTVSVNEGKYRTRRFRRRSSNGSINRQLSRCNGDGHESLHATNVVDYQENDCNKYRPGSAHSDTNLHSSCVTGRMGVDLRQIVERNIKFGVIPSCKNDKWTRSGNTSPSRNTTHSSLVTSFVDPLTSSPFYNGSQSLHRTQTNAYSISQQTNHIHTTLPTSSPQVISGDENDASMFTPFGLPAPALFPNMPYNSSSMVAVSLPRTTPDRIIFEDLIKHPLIQDISFKQPERGILKNKSSSDLKESHQMRYKDLHTCSKKDKFKHHNCGTTTKDSNSENSPNSGSQFSLSSCDTNSSSCSSSSSSSSSVSSLTSSPVTQSPGTKSLHKRPTCDLRTQSTPLPTPPTILCNAANQTDELTITMMTSRTENELKSLKPTSTNEIEECNDECNCDECRMRRGELSYKSPSEVMLTSYSSAYEIVDIIEGTSLHDNTNKTILNQICGRELYLPQVSCQYTQPYNSLNNYPYYYLTSSDQSNESKAPYDNYDTKSQITLSAYGQTPVIDNNRITQFHPGAHGSDMYSNTCFDDVSNDGTIDGSDTSSVPDTHCDLVNLANLGSSSSRPNPLLSSLLLGESTGKKRYDPPESSRVSVVPYTMILSSQGMNRSPGRLPHPNSASNYLS